MGRIVNGINILNELAEKTPKTQDYANFKGINIHRLLLKTARKYYEMALKVYIGQETVKRIDDINSNSSINEIKRNLKTSDVEGGNKWVDICGLFTPVNKIEELMNNVKSGNIKSVTELSEKLRDLYDNYDKYAWAWCAKLIGRQLGSHPDNITIAGLIRIISDWKTNAVKLNNMILRDAEKEFDSGSKTGFGIDGDEHTRDLDFLAVRGAYEENKFVAGLEKETKEIKEKADRIISLLEKML